MQQPKKVLIVGAGAAGMACAYSLSRFKSHFQVSVWEGGKRGGGVATSEEVVFMDGGEERREWINDGVQGGSLTYRNTLALHQLLLLSSQHNSTSSNNSSTSNSTNSSTSTHSSTFSQVEMKVSFGKGENNWTNYESSPLQEKFKSEIKRFGEVMKIVNKLELVFIFVPIHLLLSLFRFSPQFGLKMIYPLTALFFGTGNQTHNVSR